MDDEQTTIFYRNEVKGLSGEHVTYLYTTAPDHFDQYKASLDSLVLVIMIKYLAIGMVIGMLIGFFTATQAAPLTAQQRAALNKIASYTKDKKTNLEILTSIALVESSFNAKAVGKKGEIGLFQFHPRWFNTDGLKGNVRAQVELAEKHLTWLRRYCKVASKAQLIVAWNTGCKGMQEIAEPNEFFYYKKFRLAEEYLSNGQKKNEDQRTHTSDKRTIYVSKNFNQAI